MQDAIAQRIAFSQRLADAARGVIRPYFRHRIDVTDKGQAGFYDPVTEADRKAEEAIRAMLAAHFPQDGILGEEYGETKGANAFRWVLDPVDGTRAFINGRHEWGTLIALEKDGEPLLGLLDQPVLGERFLGVNGGAYFLAAGKTQNLAVRSCAGVAEAVLCSTHPSAYFDADEKTAFDRLAGKARMSRFGGDCYLFAVLAMGFADLIVESHICRWDVAALIPIVEGAGGIITDWQGRSCENGGRILAAGDRRAHAEAMKLLAG